LSALSLERLVANEQESQFEKALPSQAEAYRKLAAKRAEDYGLPPPSPPEIFEASELRHAERCVPALTCDDLAGKLGTPRVFARFLTRVKQEEKLMLKSAIVAASVLLATAAFAQGNTQKSGPGQSEFAPGHQPNTTKGPGHSESAPGQQPNKAGPGHSESAPGQQSTTGSSANDRTKK
jgi:hypothetical protein